MDDKVKELVEKARVAAQIAGDAAGKGIDVASKKTGELAQAAKLNKQVFDLSAELNTLMREIGKMVYDTHCGIEVDPEELDVKLNLADEKKALIAECEEKISELKTTRKCPVCGDTVGKSDRYCKHCGTVLD